MWCRWTRRGRRTRWGRCSQQGADRDPANHLVHRNRSQSTGKEDIREKERREDSEKLRKKERRKKRGGEKREGEKREGEKREGE